MNMERSAWAGTAIGYEEYDEHRMELRRMDTVMFMAFSSVVGVTVSDAILRGSEAMLVFCAFAVLAQIMVVCSVQKMWKLLKRSLHRPELLTKETASTILLAQQVKVLALRFGCSFVQVTNRVAIGCAFWALMSFIVVSTAYYYGVAWVGAMVLIVNFLLTSLVFTLRVISLYWLEDHFDPNY